VGAKRKEEKKNGGGSEVPWPELSERAWISSLDRELPSLELRACFRKSDV